MSHEKLDIYQAAIAFFALATKLCSELPKGHSDLPDQFRRASMSIPLNIAESVGKHSKPDMKRFLSIARGSAMECAAIIDVGVMLEVMDHERARHSKSLLGRIVAMLTKMIMSTSSMSTTTSRTTTTTTDFRPRPGPR
jgi:four helix bundle protein